ncbi:MAG: GerMN domain-containing protein [Clostridia bacterium]|nr:GerMN domain-containing protein [Clostridia bacterium]
MKKQGLWIIIVVFLIGGLLLSGCTSGGSEPPKTPAEQGQQSKTRDEIQGQNTPQPPAEKTVKLVVYFPDEQGNRLVPVTKVVPQQDKPLAEQVIEELIKGPGPASLGEAIPNGAKLLSLEVKDGIAYVNWSKEFQTNHWGGSTGDSNTIYSIVNSFTELPDIKKVQFLLEGKVEESIFGHVGTGEPLGRNEEILK